MKAKKTPKAKLENKKLIFRQIGAILALACVFLAFEFKNDEVNTMSEVQRYFDNSPTEIIPVTIKKPSVAPAPLIAAIVLTKVDYITEAKDISVQVSIDQKKH